MDLSEIKKALAERAESLCRHLLPGGKLKGGEWVCGDLSGAAGESLKIVLQGEKAGVWRDFSGDVGGSNLLELWLKSKDLKFQDALAAAREWLGVKESDSRKLRPFAAKQYAKPSTKGVTWVANKAEFYLHVERRIPKEVLKAYRIGMTEDETAIVFANRSEKAPFESQMLKYLALERDEGGKKKTWTSKDTAKVLFGKHTIRAEDRYLLISEGEIDCMTWNSLGIPELCCTSVPFGAKWEGQDGKDPNDEWIQNDWEFLQRFDRIYLSFDMDDAGKQARDSISRRLGRDITFVIDLPGKDANELLQAGKSDALLLGFQNAKTIDPESLKNAGTYTNAVMDFLFADPLARVGIPLPFTPISGNPYPFHIRWHEWTAVTGINGSGKSQFLGYLLIHLWKCGYPACVASMEVRPERTLSHYVGQALGTKAPSREQATAALEWLAGGFWMYDHVGETNWKTVLAIFKYAYRRYGVRIFLIDSIMKLGLRIDDLDGQGECAKAFSGFVHEFPVHLFVVMHPKKMESEAVAPGKMEIKGSGVLTDEAHNVLSVWRDIAKEAEIEKMRRAGDDELKVTAKLRMKPDTLVKVGKQRENDGDLPEIQLWFHKESKQFSGRYVGKGISFLSKEEQSTQGQMPAVTENPSVDDEEPF